MDDGEGGDLLRRDKEDLGVGRFPVTEISDAKVLVDKTIGYAENKNGGSWENVIMFMGDDGTIISTCTMSMRPQKPLCRLS